VIPKGIREVHFLTLAAAGIFLVYEATQHWFSADEWDFLAYRGVRLQGSHGILYPHNEHWVTIPILIWRGIFNLVGVRDYWLYALPLILFHLGVVYLLWRLMLRHNVEPWTATLLAAAFAILAAGTGELLIAFQFSFVGSLFFGLLAIEAVERDHLWLPAVWGICALICSGIGVPMVAASGFVALVCRKPRIAAAAVLPPALIFLIWYAAIGHLGNANATFKLNALSPGGLASYVWTGLTTSIAGFVDTSHYVGALLISVLAGAAVVRRNVPAALAAITVVLFAFLGLGRLVLGSAEAASSRYAYLAVALLLPIIGQLVTKLMQNRDLRPLMVSGLVLLVGANAVLFHADAQYPVMLNQERTQIQAAAYLISEGERFPGPFPAGSPCNFMDCVRHNDLNMPTLSAWVRHGQFPVPTTVRHSVRQAERSILGVFASPTRGYSGNLTFSELGTANCSTVNPQRSVAVNLLFSGSLRLRIASQRQDNALIVLLLHVPGVPTTPVIIPVSSVDQWLNIPAGKYLAADISAFSALRVCEAPT
jgi:hypothetical protein